MKVSIKDYIGTITIDRPDALNAMNLEVIQELHTAVTDCIRNTAVGVIILTGAGDRAFIAGADIKIMQIMTQEEALEFGQKGQALTQTIEQSPKPVIAAVNGFALGGGCEISLACHMRIASEQAQFSQPEVNLGIIPGWGGTQRLTRLVGQGKAIEMITTGKMISAAEAYRIGLVNHVVPHEELMDKTQQLANSILKNGPKVIADSLKCIRQGTDLALDKGLELELRTFSNLFESPEQNEGMSAFVEKRPPSFRK